MYVISKLNIKAKTVELLATFESEEECIKYIYELLDSKQNVNKITNVEGVKRVEQYKRKFGYIYDSESLKNIYDILLIPE